MQNKKVEDMNCKELLKLAKDLDITGRHDMKKDQLVAAIKVVQAGMKAEVNSLEEEMGIKEFTGEVKGKLVEEIEEGSGIMVEKSLEEDLVKETIYDNEWEEAPNIIPAATVYNTQFARRIPREKIEYIKKAEVGTIIAFKVSDVKLLSGMIKEKLSSGFIIQTKNGMEFNVPVEAIVWVKAGRWPKGIYEALKGIRSAS